MAMDMPHSDAKVQLEAQLPYAAFHATLMLRSKAARAASIALLTSQILKLQVLCLP
jgi:hypothetical protein